MDSNTNQPPYRLSLPVLPNTPAKVEQLRAEAAAEQDSASQPPIGAQAAHANREFPASLPAEQRELEEKVVDALRSVYDPEIPVNIYDLGLIYEIEISPDNSVRIAMTLTAPGCPVAGSLPLEVEARVEHIPEVKNARVDLVWDPPWNREMLSEVARLELGM